MKTILKLAFLLSSFLAINSCCKYVVDPSALVLNFEGISAKEFDQLSLNVDTVNYLELDYVKDYSNKQIQINFKSQYSTTIDHIITNVNNSIYLDTIYIIEAKIIKESKKCGDTNKTGVSFIHKQQNYDFKSHHSLVISR